MKQEKDKAQGFYLYCHRKILITLTQSTSALYFVLVNALTLCDGFLSICTTTILYS